MCEEVDEFYNTRFTVSADWGSVNVGELFLDMIARITSRIFVGRELSHNETWISTFISFAIDGFVGAQYLKKYPQSLKPIVAPFVPASVNYFTIT